VPPNWCHHGPDEFGALQVSAGPTLARRFRGWLLFQRGRSSTDDMYMHVYMQRGHGDTVENHGHGAFGGATPTLNLHGGWWGEGGPDADRHSVISVIKSFHWPAFPHFVICVISSFSTHVHGSMAYLARLCSDIVGTQVRHRNHYGHRF
jgi:hypothetical protein